MAVSIDTLKAGDVLYDCHRHKMGNTTMSTMGVWLVYIKEVDLVGRRVLISWNTNPDKWVGERYFRGTDIRRSPPEWLSRGFGGYSCHMCNAKKVDGHHPDCTHPKAKKAKK